MKKKQQRTTMGNRTGRPVIFALIMVLLLSQSVSALSNERKSTNPKQVHNVSCGDRLSDDEDVAQQKKAIVTGRVFDENGEPLLGVRVAVKGTSIGTATNDRGIYSLNIPVHDGVILLFSYIGYENCEIAYQGKARLDIRLVPRSIEIEGVVVTGYFDRSKKGFSGTSTVITKEELMRVSTGNVISSIAALDAGLKINENNLMGSDPNTIPDFTIRGKGSFQSGSTSPIFILDGFEVSVQKIFDLDINRVQSITLLKDASATILYGSRASNGVIVIETRTPRSGELRVQYDFKPTISIVDLTGYDLMKAAEKLEYERLADLYVSGDFDDQIKLDKLYYKKYANVQKGVNTDWLSQPVRNAFSQSHSLYVEGGASEKVRYGIDAAYGLTNGVMKRSGRDRISLGFSLIYRIKSKVTLRNYASFSYSKARNSPFGSFQHYALINPYERPKNDNGEYIPVFEDGTVNPLYDALLSNRDFTKIQQLVEQLSVEWYITDALKLKGSFEINKSNLNAEKYTSPFSSQYVLPTNRTSLESERKFVPIEKRGELSIQNGEGLNIDGNITLSYNQQITDKHLLITGLGAEIRTQTDTRNGYIVTGFPDDRFPSPSFAIQYKENTTPTSSETETRSVGVFGTANYIYDNRLFSDFSFRIDGSSRFGAKNRYASFWSVGAGWNIHNEKFIKKLKLFDLFKLRGSYGVTGNQEFNAYQAITSYGFYTGKQYYNMIGAYLLAYGNPHLKWQSQKETNFGIDLSVWKDRFRVSYNHYIKNTNDMLTNITVAPSTGIRGSSYKSNLGKIRNVGDEITINAVVIRKPEKNLEVALFFQGHRNKNTLLEISKELKNINNANNSVKKIPGNVYEEGQSLTTLKAVKSLGIDPATGKEVYLTKEGIATYVWNAADKIVVGDTEPQFRGSAGFNIYYRGWNLNAIFTYSLGADIYNQTLASRVEGADPHFNADRQVLNDRWKKPGDNARYRNIKDFKQNYISSRFVQRENFLQMGSLSLSYEFPKEMLKRIKINSLKLSGYSNNLFRLSTIKQERGLEYPFERSFVFGLNVAF